MAMQALYPVYLEPVQPIFYTLMRPRLRLHDEVLDRFYAHAVDQLTLQSG
jgi:hypothetical protein